MAKDAPAVFPPSRRGYLRHWLIAGPNETPYAGAPGPEHIMRREALDYTCVEPPATALLGEPGPFGRRWAFHFPGNNDFVEFSTFYRNLTLVDYYAFTEIVAPEAGEWRARLWSAGASDLWLNENHITRLNVTRYRNPDCRDVTLPLQRGVNRLCVRLQCLGVRDTRILFGVALLEPRGVTVRMPRAGAPAAAAHWLEGVRGDGNRGLVSSVSAPPDALAILPDGRTLFWEASARTLSFGEERPVSAEVACAGVGAALRRTLEFPGNRPEVRPPEGDRRVAHLRYIGKAGEAGEGVAGWNAIALPLLARRLLGQTLARDAGDFAAAIAMVDARQDCADFVLAGLLRMELLGLASPQEATEIERAARAFRYWTDEPGTDAMCFQSENHSLLFHGCQLLAGRRYAQKPFGNSGRSGDEQVAVALPRIRAWVEKIEARGFEEFNSGTYMPITIGAMLNVIDFGGDAELATRLSAQVDRIYRDLARHAFGGGGVISPQGRIYRDVLFPEESGTQVLLALATPATAVDLVAPRPGGGRTGDWAAFPASSPAYRPPSDLAGRICESISTAYRHADVQIILEKTPSFILTSLAVPAIPREGEHPNNDLRPGGAGYQQHLWQATLGRDCHVFVNHPGGTFDGTKSRPGYWHGNGLLPRVRQRGSVLQAIHVIADGTKTRPEITEDVWQWGSASSVRPYDRHPIDFVHAHWPTDSFDREVRRDGWVFGQKGTGLIGLWCSEPLVPHDDILTGRELRAEGCASAWLVICGSVAENGSLDLFMAVCEARTPVFDREAFTMSVNGEPDLRWWERSEPMPE